jgi:hypothetical protein
VNWEVTWPAVIAVAALALGIYNTIEQRRAPDRERQRQLWDDLRSVLVPLDAHLQDVQGQLRLGRDIHADPAVIKSAEAMLSQLGPRFSEPPGMAASMALLATKIMGAWLPWTMALHHQTTVETFTGGDYPEAVSRREEAVRQRDAAYRDLARELEAAREAIAQWIKRLDDRDRGRPRR